MGKADLRQVALFVATLSQQEQMKLAAMMLGSILAEAGANDIKFSANVPDIGVVMISIQKGDHVRD